MRRTFCFSRSWSHSPPTLRASDAVLGPAASDARSKEHFLVSSASPSGRARALAAAESADRTGVSSHDALPA